MKYFADSSEKFVQFSLNDLKKHIPGFENHFILEWLAQAEKQFNATLTEAEDGGLILKLNNSDRYIGPKFYGYTKAVKQVNMFHNLINRHYGYINKENQFVANPNFRNDYRKPIFS